MSEGIITGTIYETRLRDKNCCLRYGKKKKKYEMHHVIVLLWFPEIIFFSLCVSKVLLVKKTAEVIIIPRRVTEDQLSVALYKHSKTSNTSKSL